MSDEIAIKSMQIFCRKTLRRTILIKSNHGKYCIRTIALDRDSLEIKTQNSIFLPESMNNVVWLYLNMRKDIAIKPIE